MFPSCLPDESPPSEYLAEVPTLPADVADLAGREQLSPGEQALVESHVTEICRQIRLAQAEFAAREATLADERDALPEDEDAWIDFEQRLLRRLARDES